MQKNETNVSDSESGSKNILLKPKCQIALEMEIDNTKSNLIDDEYSIISPRVEVLYKYFDNGP